MLNTRHPVFIFWGADAICLYNDGYLATIGPERDSIALGRSGAFVWEEIWEVIGPQIAQVMAGGQATWYENHLIPVTRHGERQEAYWTYSYSPIDDETAPNGVGGVLVLVSETTELVLTRRRQEAELERFTQLFDQAPTFMAVLRGPDHRFEFTNPGYRELVNGQDFTGMTVLEAIPTAAEQGYLALLEQVYRTGEPYRGVSIPFAPDPSRKPAERRFLDFVYQPLRDASGVVNGIIVVGVDVTDRHAKDEALRESEARLRRASEAGEVALWDYDLVTGEYFWQPTVRKMFALPPDIPVTREVLFEGIHPEDRDEARAAFNETCDPSKRVPYDFEYRTVGRTDGVVRWVASKCRATFNDEGRCIRVVGTAANITERKLQEQRLRDLNHDLERKVIERTQARGMTWQLSPDLLGALNPQGYFETSNPAWLAVLGWSEEEVAATSIYDWLHPDDVEATREMFQRSQAGQPAIRFPNRHRHKDGSYRWISWTGVPEEGLVYCNGRDITEDVEQQEQLKQTEDALRQAQKMEAVGQLTGGIAHDFNNMLAVVIGSLELLDRRIGEGDARARRQVASASEAAKRAAKLTQRLLAFSRQQPLRPETVDVNKLVSNMSDLLRHSIGADVRLETVLAGGAWRVHVDPNQLENAIVNLGVNARDAMPEGGRLTIETQNTHLDRRYVLGEPGVPPGHYVLIAVTDTGSGMAPETIAKAFDPFFTTKAVGKGTGLGLSQVYGFVKQSGGHVKIYSEQGEGTTVKIYLPRTEAAVAVTDEANAADLPDVGHEEYLLVVDDEPAVRQFAVDALKELGYRVFEAETAAKALALLGDHPEIDLLFTDIVMPDTNGRGLAEQATAMRPQLKILYMTGYTRDAAVHNGIIDRSVELIGKPFTLDELAARVREILDRGPRGFVTHGE